MSKVIGTINIHVSGKFLEGLSDIQANRIKNLAFDFSKGETLHWENEVYKSLTTRIGFYTIINNVDEIIYVGLANGEAGLRGRHQQHEKNNLFELFDAEKITVYYADELDEDDAGQIALLERYLIYALEPILNDDIKQSKSTLEFIIDKIKEKMNEILNDPVFIEIVEMQDFVNEIEDYDHELDELIKEEQKHKEFYLEAIIDGNKSNREITDFKKKYKDSNNKLRDYIKKIIKEINKTYKVYSFIKTYAK
jgi:hypothetical protein